MAEHHAKYPPQTKFWKSFGRYGIFLGTVVGYNSDDGVYKCYYEGDGDEEDLTEEEIESWLKRYPSVAKMNHGAKKQKRMQEQQPNKARKATPEKKQSRKDPPTAVATIKERRAQEDKRWKEWFQKLKAFREAHGHARVPRGWPQDPSLGNWVNNQRENYRQGTLQAHRQTLLEEEGFEFFIQKRSWEENFARLADYKKRFGTTHVPVRWEEDPMLGRWVRMHRVLKQKGKLDPDKEQRLDQLGFEFGPLAVTRPWDENYQLLVDHKKRFGGFSNITRDGPHKKLSHWITAQRQKHWQGRLPADHKKLLDKLGLEFQKQLRTFEENFHLLLEFQKIHGHTNVPNKYQDTKLAGFVGSKRLQYRANQIPKDQQKKLEKIGFRFRLNEKSRTFEENYELLLEFKEESGHVNVPKSWDKTLGRWMSSVRCGHTRLNEAQEKKLSDVGFEWRRINRTWQESFDALLFYKKKHGSCDIPRNYKKDTALGRWVSQHRSLNLFNALDPEKKDQLKAIGFHPNSFETKPAGSLKSSPTAQHTSKSKKRKAATISRSSQTTKPTRAAKQRARRNIENQVDQESSSIEPASDIDSYDSDESSTWSESTTRTGDNTASFLVEDAVSLKPIAIGNNNQLDHPKEVISVQTQAKDRCSASEAGPDKAASSTQPAQSAVGAGHPQNASRVAPDLARSASATTRRSGSPHSHTRSKAVVPDTAKSEAHEGEPEDMTVPDATESRSTCAAARVVPQRNQMLTSMQQERESNQKLRWLFDQ